MAARLDSINRAGSNEAAQVAPEAAERLRALGYVSGSAAIKSDDPRAPNPARGISTWVAFEAALNDLRGGRPAAALASLGALARTNRGWTGLPDDLRPGLEGRGTPEGSGSRLQSGGRQVVHRSDTVSRPCRGGARGGRRRRSAARRAGGARARREQRDGAERDGAASCRRRPHERSGCGVPEGGGAGSDQRVLLEQPGECAASDERCNWCRGRVPESARAERHAGRCAEWFGSVDGPGWTRAGRGADVQTRTGERA